MVRYARNKECALGKLTWRLVAMHNIYWRAIRSSYGYRGEGRIEPSSSWSSPKPEKNTSISQLTNPLSGRGRVVPDIRFSEFGWVSSSCYVVGLSWDSVVTLSLSAPYLI